MTFIETILIAFSMFSALPVPQTAWNEKNMRYTMAAFPLVGAVTGLFCVFWALAAERLALPAVLKGAGLCVLPVLITGGIHLDGYADTWDALSSHGTTEKKQSILKDPHLGTFAVIHLCVYFLLSFALWTSLPAFRIIPVILCFTLSRTLSGLSVASFTIRPGSGLVRTFSDALDKTRVRNVLIVLAVIQAVLLCIFGGWLMVPAAFGVFLVYRHLTASQFGGLSGDLSGWFLQTAELWMLGAMFLQQTAEAAL